VFPIGVQTPVASTERRGGRSALVLGIRFLTAMAVLPVCQF
jgi:hypothetical protein